MQASTNVHAGTVRQQKASGKKRKQNSKRRGRRKTQEKIDEADRAENVLPDGFTFRQCTFVYERPVWRIENGQAVRVAYQIYRGPNGQKANIEGVLSRSEFGIEIHISVAYLTFIPGLSIDKVCAQLKFFWNLDLSKSQADSLLNQLSKQWENEFESLCPLLAISAVVNTDETSWSINSVWAFLSEKVRILVFGCRKDGVLMPRERLSQSLHQLPRCRSRRGFQSKNAGNTARQKDIPRRSD